MEVPCTSGALVLDMAQSLKFLSVGLFYSALSLFNGLWVSNELCAKAVETRKASLKDFCMAFF